MKKRILVTGGLGFIGSYFVSLLLDRGYAVVNVDKKTYSARQDVDFHTRDDYEFIEADICQLEHLPNNVEWVVNFAAESHVDNSITANKIFFESNIRGVYNLLELIRAKDPSDRPLFLQVSTDEVYGDVLAGSRLETDMLKPSNPYSATKAAAEQLVFGWGKTYGIQYSICRSSNNYGYGQYPEKLIPKTIEFALQGKPMTIHGDGSYQREWTFVGDNCTGILMAMEKGTLGQVYNISSGDMLSNLTIVKKTLRALGKPEDFFEFVENRVGQDVRYSIGSPGIRALGWRPAMTLEAYLPEYVALCKKNYEQTNGTRSSAL